jgi:hypothetical protein
MIIKQLKNCNIIVSGDFNQLDVIGDLHKYDYKNSSILKELCDHNNINLQTCRRSNDKLFNLIQFDNINNLTPDDFKSDIKIDNDINICWTNNTRKQINSKYMDEAYKKDKTSNWIEIKKLEYDDNSQDVILVNKTPLIAKVNNGNLKLINNERYIIKKVLDNLFNNFINSLHCLLVCWIQPQVMKGPKPCGIWITPIFTTSVSADVSPFSTLISMTFRSSEVLIL